MDNRIETASRAETVALGGGFLQLAVSVALLILSLHSPEKLVLQIIAAQTGAGVAVFLACFAHLRLRRARVLEQLDREQVENSRHAQGLASLFSPDDIPPAERNWRQFNKYLTPVISVVIALLLLTPLARLLAGEFALFSALPLKIDVLLGILPLLAAFLLFLTGTYASGLARVPAWRNLRAGAGYALVSALWLALLGVTALLGFKISFYPLRVAALLTVAGATLQAVEILLTTVFEHYRPRVAKVEPRAPYDSRLSGLLAEPEGVFQALSQTLDYQFGFRVSDTWFFRFVEKSLAPLVLLMLATLWLMSCVVVVAPGHAVVVERFGAPRGLGNRQLQAVDWDAFAREYPPLKNGLHFKLPFPFERVLTVTQDRSTVLTFGHREDDAPAVADDGHGHGGEAADESGAANWEVVHATDETQYLMPLLDRDAVAGKAGGPDVMLLSGEFLVEYRIASDADVYRFLYNYRDGAAMLPVLVERELTASLAGEDFWRVLTAQADIGTRVFDRLAAAIRDAGLGLTAQAFIIANTHPPAGETGKAFLAVTSSAQRQETEINDGKIEATKILGLAPAEAEEVVNEAEAYKRRRTALAQADRDWFAHQLQAYAAAGGIFRAEKEMRMLENGLGKTRKVLLPNAATLIMDDSKAIDPNDINSIMARQLAGNE
ncbi:hypothetical protein FACS1894139_06060 [Planctomycetales bacterium]|nr:hypothetical protein FACS1894107_00410 [Planctomycetales bacterium]GHS96188.1 hypothetical protein FACS1894108_00380 [Planctomycetales bacterium]GHT04244.1 hypothetical protein FACS1894139_06060 [Planctomycetales bacterium]